MKMTTREKEIAEWKKMNKLKHWTKLHIEYEVEKREKRNSRIQENGSGKVMI